MLKIVLFEPEIPPNTGNIIRLCANTGCSLHLIEPLGFDLSDKKMRRAGLDYSEYADVKTYASFADFCNEHKSSRLFGLSTKGRVAYHNVDYRPGDTIVFGPETRGLPDDVREQIGRENTLRIPMKKDSRSLNLSNSVALVAYEGLRQLGFSELE